VSRLARRRQRGGNRIAGPSNERIKLLLLGALLGFAWGSVLWGITSAAGQGTGAAGWAYFALTCAMIGGGIGGIFAAAQARRRGERMTPRIRLPFRRR
jgi:hypothetical protein